MFSSTSEDDEPVRWQVDRSRAGHPIPSVAVVDRDPAEVADRSRIEEAVIRVAVEDLPPPAAAGEADAVPEAVHLLQIADEEHVLPDAFDPSVDGDHAIDGIAGRHAQRFASQPRHVAP